MPPDEKPNPTPPAAAPPANPPANPPPADDEVRLSKDQLNERLARAQRSAIKKFGVESEEELAARLKELDDLKKAEEERKKAAMTEADRIKAEAEEAKAAAARAQAEAAAARAELETERLARSNGVTQVDYMRFKLDSHIAKLGEEERKTFDRDAYVKQLLQDARERVALGLDAPAAAAPTQTVSQPASTGPKPPANTPNPPGAGTPAPQKSAMDMSSEEWAARKAQLGIP